MIQHHYLPVYKVEGGLHHQRYFQNKSTAFSLSKCDFCPDNFYNFGLKNSLLYLFSYSVVTQDLKLSFFKSFIYLDYLPWHWADRRTERWWTGFAPTATAGSGGRSERHTHIRVPASRQAATSGNEKVFLFFFKWWHGYFNTDDFFF